MVEAATTTLKSEKRYQNGKVAPKLAPKRGLPPLLGGSRPNAN